MIRFTSLWKLNRLAIILLPIGLVGCSDDGGINLTLDSDGDGIQDIRDFCPATPAGESVKVSGCALTQLDTDSDGVTDDIDQCPEDPQGNPVDVEGCADFQRDSDFDKVTDDLDQCPDTLTGAPVTADGCSPWITDSATVILDPTLPEAIVSGSEVHARLEPIPPGVAITTWKWSWVTDIDPAFPHPGSYPVLTGANTSNPSFTAVKSPSDPPFTLLLHVQATGDNGEVYEGVKGTLLVDALLPVTVPVGANAGEKVSVHARPPRAGGEVDWVVDAGLSPTFSRGPEKTEDAVFVPGAAGTGDVIAVWVGPNGEKGVGSGEITIIAPNTAQQASTQSLVSAQAGQRVTLSVASAEQGASYLWRQLSGAQVQITGIDSATPRFTAPAVTQVTSLKFLVEVTGTSGTVRRDVEVVVHPAVNTAQSPLVANAGFDRTVKSGETVTLHADVTQSGGGALTYAWREITSQGLVFSDSAGASTDVTIPVIDLTVPNDFRAEVELVVTENGQTFSDHVNFTIQRPRLETASSEVRLASAPMQVEEHLSARVNDVIAPVAYQWAQTAGPAATLDNPSRHDPSFQPSAPGTYEFEVTITDAVGNILSDTLSLDVAPLPTAPKPPSTPVTKPTVTLLDAGSVFTEGDQVTPRVDALGFSGAVTYSWQEITGVLQSIDAATGRFDAPNVPGHTVITLKVTATDGTDTATNQADYYIDDARLELDQPPGTHLLPPVFVGTDTTLTLHGVGGVPPLTYAWSVTSGPLAISGGSDQPAVQFSGSTAGKAELDLKVTDSVGNSVERRIAVLLQDVPPPPQATTAAFSILPAANVQDVIEGDSVTLAPTVVGAQSPTYQWTVDTTNSSAIPTLGGANQASVSVTAPTVDTQSLAVLKFAVTDQGQTIVVPVLVNIIPRSYTAVAARVGTTPVPKNTDTSLQVTLTGSPVPDPSALTYSWTVVSKPSGSKPVLTDDDTATPTFSADLAGAYQLRAEVGDSFARALSNALTVTVVPDLGLRYTAPADGATPAPDATVTLTVEEMRGSTAVTDAATYDWRVTSGAATVTVPDNTKPTASLALDNPGSIAAGSSVAVTVLATVTDTATSETASVSKTVTFTKPAAAPPSGGSGPVPAGTAGIQCAKCTPGLEALCGNAFAITKVTCPAGTGYCGTSANAPGDGSRYFTRSCVTPEWVYKQWWVGSSDDEDCQDNRVIDWTSQNIRKVVDCDWAYTKPRANLCTGVQNAMPGGYGGDCEEAFWENRKN